MSRQPAPKPCTHHRLLSHQYLAWHDEAERRHRAGNKQSRCPKCGYWLWDDEIGVPLEEP